MRSRLLLPFCSGNGAALQHEEGLAGCSQGEEPRISGRPPPVLGDEKRRGGRRGGLEDQRTGAHGPCCAEAAREWQGSPGQREPSPRSQAGGGPGTWRVSPRPGRGPGSAGRCGQSEALPQGGLGHPGRREVGSGARGSAAQHMGHLPSGSSTRGSHLRDWQLPEDGGVGEGGWPGGAGRGLEAGAGSAGAFSPLAASAASSGGGGRSRKLSDLVGGNTKTNGSQDPVPARRSPQPLRQPPPAPAAGYDLGRPRLSQAGRSEARTARRSCLRGRHRHLHLRRRLSLPCQRRPP